MKFINKLLAILILRTVVGPNMPAGVGGLVLSLWALTVAGVILFYAIFWEYMEQLADLTALNEVVEQRIKRSAMKTLEFFERDI